jgi:PQQ-like domain
MRRLLPVVVVVIGLAACGGAAGDGTKAAAPAAEPPIQVAKAGHDWPMFGVGPQKSNDSTAATGITARNAAKLRRARVSLPGTVDSSPIYLHAARVHGKTRPIIIVTTTYGRTLALSAPTGRALWSFTPSSYAKLKGTYRITTSTPVADASRAYVYTTSPDGLVHKLRVADGREVRTGPWPVSVTKLPEREKLASSLNLVGRDLIVATDGYIGDEPPYQGHVVEIDRVTGKTIRVWNSLCAERRFIQVPSTCAPSDSAIWGRAGVVADLARGHLLLATGNAPYDGKRNFGDSLVVLTLKGLTRVGGWTPADQAHLNDNDLDLGSTSPALLPGDLAAQGGKAGKINLVDLKRGRSIQTVSTPGGQMDFTAPAVIAHGAKATLIETSGGGTEAWSLRGRRLHKLWSNGTAGTSPVVAGGLAWIFDPEGHLNAYVPATGRRVAHLTAGSGHWNTPVIADGRVWLPEGDANDHATSGTLSIYTLR